MADDGSGPKPKLRPSERRAELRQMVRVLRNHTGGFDSRDGYGLNQKFNGGKARAIRRYYNKLSEIMARPVTHYFPKTRKEKREAFEFTGQTGFPKFDVALVHKPDENAEWKFELDETRPKGSQFVPYNVATGQRFYHIPSKAFLDIETLPADFLAWLAEEYGEDPHDLVEEDNDTQLFERLIEYYANDADFFLIQAGESYMWGAGGGREKVAEKIRKIIRNYGPNLFNANDTKSSYYGNWFRGVTAFTSRYDILPQLGSARQARKEFAEKYKIKMFTDEGDEIRYRVHKDGAIARYVNGNLTERRYPNGNIEHFRKGEFK